MPKDRFVRWGLRQSKVKRKLHNPYFQRSRSKAARGRLQGWKGILKGLGIAIAAAAALVIPFEACTNPVFAIQEVKYDFPDLFVARQSEIKTVVEAALDEPLLGGLSRKNFFLAPIREIDAAIRGTGSYATVKVKRIFPKGIEVTVQSPKRVFLIKDGADDKALAGESGEVIDLLNAHDASSTPPGAVSIQLLIGVIVEHDASSTLDISLGKEIIPPNCATLISGIDEGVKRIGFRPLVYHLSEDHTKVIMEAGDGWRLITDPIAAANDQVERLAAVLRDPRYKDRRKLDYVDVRYPERVYVKMR